MPPNGSLRKAPKTTSSTWSQLSIPISGTNTTSLFYPLVFPMVAWRILVRPYPPISPQSGCRCFGRSRSFWNAEGSFLPVWTYLTPTTISGSRSNVGVVAHELSHSFSGNLVTAGTWGDFWLNEGCEWRVPCLLFHYGISLAT